ncbi:MAG TPA: molybdate ABC transporter substrate-binding protein, partial [Rhizobiales bacterium]|nr:molybdate ABC transporter substrate-binding protein [Hyphomicrobiales bacterium]
MHFLHGLYAQLSLAKHVAMHHFSFIDDFLIDRATFLTPSPLGCCPPDSPAISLTPLADCYRPDQKNTRSRIVSVHSVRSGFLLLGLATLTSAPANAETITIATAANFQTTLKALQEPFTRQTGLTVTIVTGSSGALANQIINGAPYDVFLSADKKRPQQLIDKGVADKDTLFTYAYGRLTLWSRDKNLIASGNGPAILQAGKFRHIAYANPALAPYGLAAVETLRSLNLFFELSDKTVRGENISQTFTMLATGAAQIGFIARAQLASSPWKSTGSYWHIP